MDAVTGKSGWARFWDRGRWWKALLLAVSYFVLYQLASLLMAPFASMAGDAGSVPSIVIFYIVPIFLGGVILVTFGASVGWLRGLFARQPVGGRGWMWIAIAVVLFFNVLHLLSIDYGAAGIEYVLAWLFAGLLIGFAEEVLTRGYIVRIMRNAGHPEIAVAAVSAALFSLLHAGNLLSGQPLINTLLQLGYTFGFGVLMYLAMRVTRTLVAPILLHASTDPSIFLHTEYPVAGALGSVAGLGNILVFVVGVVLLFFIRGRVDQKASVVTGGSTRAF